MIDPRSLNDAQRRDAFLIGLQVISACNVLTGNSSISIGTFAIDGMNPQSGLSSFAVLITNKPTVVEAIRADQDSIGKGLVCSSVHDTHLWQLVADAMGVDDPSEMPEPPLVAGGQGRSDEDVVISRSGLLAVIGLLGAIIVSGAVYAAVYWLLN